MSEQIAGFSSPEAFRMSRMVVGGAWLAASALADDALVAWVERCLERGLTTFDNADVYGDYGCEERLGRVLRKAPELRERMQLGTKCGINKVSPRRPEHRVMHYDTSKAHIVASVENSLRNFRTDRLDLLLIHRPDPLMDYQETAAAFTELRERGLVLHFGVSNFLPSQFEDLSAQLDFPLVTNQVEFSVLGHDALESGALDLCQRRGIPLMAWSPLAAGRLFTRDDERRRRVFGALESVGEEMGGVPVDRVALAWILTHPAQVIPITGARTLDELDSARAALPLRLTRQQWFAIYEASRGFPVP